MVDETGPPLVSLAGGFFSGRVDSEYRESAQVTYYQLQSVDFGPTGTGATVGSAMISQATGYQIQAAITGFTTVTPAVTGNGNTPTAAAVLPQTNRPFPFAGLLLYVGNTGANPINLFAHPNDTGNAINGLTANTPIVLGVNTITALQCYTPGIWQADGIGEGFNGSIATVVSQGTIAASGTTAANSTLITQAMLNVTATATTQGVTLPPAKAGTQVAINGGGGGAVSFLVWPGVAGTDNINALGAGASFTFTNPSTTGPTIFFCFNNGNWQTK